MCPSNRDDGRHGEEGSAGVASLPGWLGRVDATAVGVAIVRVVPGLEPGAPKRNALLALCYGLCALVTADVLGLD